MCIYYVHIIIAYTLVCNCPPKNNGNQDLEEELLKLCSKSIAL